MSDELIPPPTDNEWLALETRNAVIRATSGGGLLIEPITTKSAHRCELPQQWALGTLWKCPEGHLWVVDEACDCRGDFYRHSGRGAHVVGLAWWPATWRQRRRYGPGMKRAHLTMAHHSTREQNAPKPNPPKGPSGVSPSPDGRR